MKFSKSKLFSIFTAALTCSSSITAIGYAGDLNLSSADPKNCIPAVAQEREALGDALWTGPLLAPSAGCLPKGHIGISPYFIDGITNNHFDSNWNIKGSPGSTRHSLASITSFTYGITNYLEIGATPQFGYNFSDRHNKSSSVKPGDTSAKLQLALMKYHEGSWMPNMVLAVGEVFPTGSYDNLDLYPANGLGTGAYQTYVDVCTQEFFWMPTGRILSARLGLIYNFTAADVSVNNASVYGTTKGFHGHADPGHTFTADIGLEYSLTRHWVPAFDILYQHSDSTSIRGQQTTRFDSGLFVQPVKFSAPSGELFAVAPALEYNWSENWGVIAGAQVNLAGRNSSLVVAPQVALSIYY